MENSSFSAYLWNDCRPADGPEEETVWDYIKKKIRVL